MKYAIHRVLVTLLCAAAVFICFPLAFAREAEDTEAVNEATDISGTSLIVEYDGFPYCDFLFDDYIYYGKKSNDSAYFTVAHEEGIGSIYLIFQREYGTYTITNNENGQQATVGEHGFLHAFVDLQELFGNAPKSITVSFPNGAVELNEVYLFTPGEVPDFVQKWNTPQDGKTDLILFSTHGDDEQLFFAGLLPYYAVERDMQVQVVYLTNHRNDSLARIHEMLNGLWAVGVDTYPVFGPYPDFRVGPMELTYTYFNAYGFPKEQMLGFVVEQLRRFKPLVVVGHDFNGEYGHGQHMVYADLLAKALEISNDPEQYPELAESYGTWDVPKAYFHLYWENEILMDWDQPLESFDGMTAFQVSKELGFSCHISQQGVFGFWIIPYETAAEIPVDNPSAYGLYRSTVGEDINKNDMFENLISYAEQARLEEEARLKAEEEARLAAEEAQRQAEEQARLEAEAKAKAEAEAQAKAKAEEEARLLREKEQRKQQILLTLVTVTTVVSLFLSHRFHKKRR